MQIETTLDHSHYFIKRNKMRYAKVLLDFIVLTLSVKITFYRNIIAALTDNILFSELDASLADAKTAVDALELSILNAADGSHTAKALMHAQAEVTDKTFRKLAASVDIMSDGNEASILSSGFRASKPLPARQKDTLTAKEGKNSGCVDLAGKAHEKGKAYIWQSAEEPLPGNEEVWIIIGHSTSASFSVCNLIVGKRYRFRFAAITPDGVTDYCEPVSRIVT